MLYKQSLWTGAGFIVASELLLVSMGAVIKTLAQDMPNETIVFFRNLFGLAALAPFLVRGGLAGLRTGVCHLHLLRALAGLGGMYCYYYAIGHIKLADAMLLKFTVPIFIPVVAWFWLSERFSDRAALALLLGFAGVVLIMKPAGDVNWLLLVALAGSFLAAIAKTAVRRLSRTEPAGRVVFYFAAIGVLVSAVPLSWAWRTPSSPEQWLLLLSLGPLATLGQFCMTRGYAAAPASEVGLFTFSAVLFGAGYGWLFWGELWDWVSLAGAFLVAGAGAIMLRSEPRRADEMTREEEPGVSLAERERAR